MKIFGVIGMVLAFVAFLLNPYNSAIGTEVSDVPLATMEAAKMMWRAGKHQAAIDIWTDLSAKGNKTASWTLYSIYANDSPIGPANGQKVIEILLPLSEAGVADARELIGDLYYFGRLVPQSDELAYQWYTRYMEIEQDTDIVTRYATLIALGQGTTQNKLRAYKLLFEAGATHQYMPAFLIGQQLFQDLDQVEQFMARSYMSQYKQELQRRQLIEQQ